MNPMESCFLGHPNEATGASWDRGRCERARLIYLNRNPFYDMMSIMVLKRQLAALIWAATVLIAAQFLPTVAEAHAGHDHASHSVAAAHGVAAPLSDHVVDPAESANAERAAAPTELASVNSNNIPAAPSGGCNGSCCGTGNACCGAVLLFSSAVLPDVGGGQQPVGTASSAPPGIGPDALRKPPKSFA